MASESTDNEPSLPVPSALLGPVFAWVLQRVGGGAEEMYAEHYQTAFVPMLYGVGLAIVLVFF